MIDLRLGDCLDVMKTLPDGSVDAVVTDPPYLYLDHKLDAQFNEYETFKEIYRVLKPDSLLVFFGRGESFYRWNVICKELGFKFKEELIWDKSTISSPVTDLMRCHETIAVYAKGNKRLNKVWINKIEYDLLSGDVQKLEADLKMIISKINAIKTGDEFMQWRDGEMYSSDKKPSVTNHAITRTVLKGHCRARHALNAQTKGKRLSSIIRVNREHYQFEHPTQKPVELIKQLLLMASNAGDLILDPFAGSGTTPVACKLLGRDCIAVEKDAGYFEIGKARVENTPVQKSVW